MITFFQSLTAPRQKSPINHSTPARRLVHDLKDDQVDSIALRTNSRDAVYMDSSGAMTGHSFTNEEFWRVITQSSADVELVEHPAPSFVSIVLTWLLVFLVGRALIDRMRGAVTPWKS